MIPDQRREELLRYLRESPILSVRELTERLGVSHMTVRRDIEVLERAGRAYSVPGGVRLAGQLEAEPSRDDKETVDVGHKRAMARAAADLVSDDMTIYLDAGTTILAMVPHIVARQRLTVVTNDFSTLDALVDVETVDVIHVGGLLDHRNRSSVGRLAAATLRSLNVDIAFISSSSWDAVRGVTTPHEAKVDVKRAALDVSAKQVLVAGSVKYGLFATHRVAQLGEFDSVLTDDELPEGAAAAVRDRGTELVLATDPAGAPRSLVG
ncbi:DeoR/GlpR transcriptional regulator [Ruania alkalisoli]|uniref:DeoR/GlpR transcriptional regulator n=1 Tax=Ruania alkalisoli TaxID=2779775 RepID=A0A7M1STJ2_9MICO|nr:DeoR/GlpR family DNA-binding transcription regulator [Ruania alkalisoli]QOR70886.1 DeoR/GlpR transcriptional regulator [Ruania alkalisoli]